MEEDYDGYMMEVKYSKLTHTEYEDTEGYMVKAENTEGHDNGKGH